ncbi:hypothetical protein M407DRAFT_241474 [Tulasnella calospora MUT 4182]|uniref:Uncharacterized protein n=1 Tax=Tulasnella calospora MUT 4182 TaxID=1051891 RepID=A0A0C3QTE1_9AGAM|nr:hypothetical protein M407DRAFT_241474 [Tulasnella calospora MUT 4182]
MVSSTDIDCIPLIGEGSYSLGLAGLVSLRERTLSTIDEGDFPARGGRPSLGDQLCL